MKEIVITSAVRTAIGSFGGTLKDMSAVDLGVIAAKAALERAGIEGKNVDEAIMGCVLQAGYGQNIARQVARNAGLPDETPAATINMVCGSGLKAVELGAQSILCGNSDVVLAGGTESMSQAPYVMKKARWGAKMGDISAQDCMVYDGLTDAFSGKHMGITAENVALRYGISRLEQDAFAAQSQRKAKEAIEAGRFQAEIVPVMIPQRKGDPIAFERDEYPRESSAEALAKLKPAFQKDGSVTAGNASGINDGAAAVTLMSRERAEQANVRPLASIMASACVGVDPDYMGIGPVPALQKALQRAGLKKEDIELFELNEAFAAQSLAVVKELGIDPALVNVNGGAIALGHPIGASGTRVLVSLLYEMEKRNLRYGACALCIGGGMGIAMILNRG